MPILIANKDMTYASRGLVAGESFEATSQDARALLAVGVHSKGRAGASLPVEKVAVEADPAQKTVDVKPGTYKRRDLKAE